MANPGLAAGGIILLMIGLVAFFVPVENYLGDMMPESEMSTEEVCDSLGKLMPKYAEYCETGKGVMENPSPLIIFGSYGFMGIGIIMTIVGLVQKKKEPEEKPEPEMFLCEICDYAANTKADLHNHMNEEHKEPEDDENTEDESEPDKDKESTPKYSES